MGTVQGLTLSRALELHNENVVAGLVDVNGHLLLTKRDGTQIDAGMVKGNPGDPAVYPFPSYASGTDTRYVRIGVIDGVYVNQGAAFQFILSGIGSFGTARRGTVLVHAVQRGTGGISLLAWSWGMESVAANSLVLYTRKTGDYLFEIWAKVGTYTPAATVSVLSAWGATLTLNQQLTDPGSLVATTIERSDSPAATTALAGISELATAAETVTGTDNVRSTTPLAIAGLRATQAQVDAGTDAARYVTPKTLKENLDATYEVPNSWLGTGATGASIGGTGWGGITGALRLEMGVAYTRPLLVELNYGALGVTNTGYWMIGMSCFNDPSSPAWNVPPENGDPSFDGYNAGPLYGMVAPFSQATQQIQLKGQKRVIVPAGVKAIFQMAARKSVSSAVATMNYSSMEINFLRFL